MLSISEIAKIPNEPATRWKNIVCETRIIIVIVEGRRNITRTKKFLVFKMGAIEFFRIHYLFITYLYKYLHVFVQNLIIFEL